MAKKEVGMFGCLSTLWSLMTIAVLAGMNGTLWYMLLSHIEAPPVMWSLFWVWIPAHCVLACVGTVLGLLKDEEKET